MKQSLLFMVLLFIIPVVMAAVPMHEGVPGSKVVFVGGSKQVIKSPFQYFTIHTTADARTSRYRPQTYIQGGDIGVFEKPSKGLNVKAPEYLSYGIPKSQTYISTRGNFVNHKLVYGVDTQVIKRFVRGGRR